MGQQGTNIEKEIFIDLTLNSAQKQFQLDYKTIKLIEGNISEYFQELSKATIFVYVTKSSNYRSINDKLDILKRKLFHSFKDTINRVKIQTIVCNTNIPKELISQTHKEILLINNKSNRKREITGKEQAFHKAEYSNQSLSLSLFKHTHIYTHI